MSLHKRWSPKVQLPVGTEWGQPYHTSVAECMVWKTNTARDPYQDSLGKAKGTVPKTTAELQREEFIERCEPDGQYYHGNDLVAGSRNSTKLRARPPTPMRQTTRNVPNYASGQTSYYVNDHTRGQGYTQYRNDSYREPLQVTGRQSRLDTERSLYPATTRARSVGVPYEEYTHPRDNDVNGDYVSTRDDDAELIASFLEARDSETYHQAKQDLYNHTYQKQLDDERHRLYLERQKEYDAHVQAHSGHSNLDTRALQDALKKHVRVTSAKPHVVSRPPVAPRPPIGAKSEHSASYTDPRSRRPPVMVENLRVTAYPDNDKAVQNLQRAALGRTLNHAPDYNDNMHVTSTKPVKRVNFRSRPQSACSAMNRHKKGSHFFDWRDATEQQAGDMWKSSKYQNVQPRVDNRWTTDPFTYRKKEDNKVNVNLECPDGEEMNVSLRIEAAPSRTFYM